MLLFLTTNMAIVTSRANQQLITLSEGNSFFIAPLSPFKSLGCPVEIT